MARDKKKASRKPAAKAVAAKGSRRRRLTRAQKRQVDKVEARRRVKLPGSLSLLRRVFGLFRAHWKTLGGIMLVYLILNILFASGLSSIGDRLSTIKNDLQSNHHLGSALGAFSSLIGSAGTSSSQGSSILQSFLIIFESLVVIWALRQLISGHLIRVKEAYYQSMAPLTPFLLVIVVLFIQLLPLTLGASLLALVISTAFVGNAVLTTLGFIVFGLLAAWSIYMLSSSIFALYIVTLPDMQPRQALRSAKKLVRFHRWALIRKVLFLPVFIFLGMAVLVVPLILYVQWLAAPMIYILNMLALLFVHAYLYSLYRSLLNE